MQTSAPLSFAQVQMWLMDQMAPGNPAYHLPVGYRLTGSLDLGALEASFNEIIRRHEILRTTFAVNDGEPVQVVHPECRIEIALEELDHLAPEDRERAVHVRASQEALAPFDLSRLPLIRVSLFKLDRAEHVLIVNSHHIVGDGVSIGLMLEELGAFYRLFTGTSADRPPELARQYADYARGQRQSFREASHAGEIAYWRRRLDGRLPVLELPSDLPRPRSQSFKGSNVFVDLHRPLAEKLTALGAREGCALFTTLLAAFQVLLHRYSGANDILIGTPLTMRTPGEFEALIGAFLNMVTLRCDLRDDPTFLQVLRRTRGTTLHAFGRANVPFEQVVEHLTFERDPSRSPIFQTMVEMLPAATSQIGDLQISTFYFDLGFAQFDLSLHIWEEPDRYVCRFEYCTDLFKADTIERMAANFLQLLSAVDTAPEEHISKIGILTDGESRVLAGWNNTSRPYPRDLCVHQLFEERASTMPNRVAVECGGRVLTYGELNAKANQLANYLIELGIGPEALVGICLERSLDLVVGLLGILKAGAAYVPMDPAFPPDRLAYMMQDAAISVLVTLADLAETLPRSKRAICLDADDDAIQQRNACNPDRPAQPTQLAYTIYTSGSSGNPKGVAIEHRSVANFLASMQREPGFDERDVIVAVTTISFDIAALEIFLPLVSGGRLVMGRANEVIDGSLLAQLMERSSATVLQATPSTWKLLLDANWEVRPGFKMLCGGEPLPRELANRLLEQGGELWNMYGPTETTIWSSVHRIERGEGPTLIGPPIGNTQFHVVDNNLELTPIGVPGELLIGGDGLSRGYLNLTDLTADRFIENPFSASGRAVYRTGDLVRSHPNGCFEFLGRRDFQVKVRGYRIELEEVERVLTRHEAVKDAAVVIWEDHEGDKRLVAHYIPAAGKKADARDFRNYLRTKLPEYMCPSFFVETETFPYTPNGKVDRKAFPPPESSTLEPSSNQVPPERELEVRLAALWQLVLKRPSIGIDDNFFELGGHSLLAARLFALIEKKLEVKLPLALLFEAPTIRKLADKIEQRTWGAGWNSLVPIQTGGTRPPLFLIHGAEGNVLLYRSLIQALGRGQPVYALQSRGLDGRERPESKIENMAANYVEEIESVQPSGPYYLGGYCLGGTIALEIAQRLTRAGKSVAFLAMFESYNIRTVPALSPTLRLFHKAQNVYFHAQNVLLSLRGGRTGFFAEKFRVEASRFRVRCDILRAKMVRRFNPRSELRYQHLLLEDVNDQAQSVYEPTSFDGRVVLFRPKGHFERFDDPHYGWGPIAKQGVRIIEMPNYPRGCLTPPFVEILAERLEAEIDETLQEPVAGRV